MSSGSRLPDDVSFTHLDQELFDRAGATKGDLTCCLDALVAGMLRCWAQRPLSVICVLPGQVPFMQADVPSYTLVWVPTALVWAVASRREVLYALFNDPPMLLWVAIQL